MASPSSEYGYISAKLKARSSRFLADEGIERVVRSKSLQEAFLNLRGSFLEGLEAQYAASGDLKSVEAFLASKERNAYAEIVGSLAGPAAAFIDAYAEKHSIDLLKDALRLWFDAHVRSRPIEDRAIYLGNGKLRAGSGRALMDLTAVSHAASFSEVAQALSSTVYGPVVSTALPEAVSKGSLFELECALDRLYFDGLFSAFQALSPRDRASVERLVGLDVDIQNIANLVRLGTVSGLGADAAQKYLMDFSAAAPAAELARSFSSDNVSGMASTLLGSEARVPNLGALERLLRRMRLSEARKRLAGDPFSIGIVMAYFVLFGEEVRRVRMILNAKYFGLSEDRLRSAV